ncbi:MAG: hypothetical protein BWX47_01169 [candidate division Hyd24-12 bacterium ADurb.Bin004]|nr:MAG: hypothetical protein BWX47_01169 [candidate division Hyd24-12 bacterium ADurb.Bin004]
MSKPPTLLKASVRIAITAPTIQSTRRSEAWSECFAELRDRTGRCSFNRAHGKGKSLIEGWSEPSGQSSLGPAMAAPGCLRSPSSSADRLPGRNTVSLLARTTISSSRPAIAALAPAANPRLTGDLTTENHSSEPNIPSTCRSEPSEDPLSKTMRRARADGSWGASDSTIGRRNAAPLKLSVTTATSRRLLAEDAPQDDITAHLSGSRRPP